jgi:hypothetical protein
MIKSTKLYNSNFDINQIKKSIYASKSATSCGPSGLGNEFLKLLVPNSGFMHMLKNIFDILLNTPERVQDIMVLF